MDEKLAPCEERIVTQRARKQLSFGVPKELRTGENRLMLTPQATEVLVAQGHKVLVEKNAGLMARFSDEAYAAAGADIVSSPQHVWRADVVVKVAPPTLAEAKLLREGQSLVMLASRHLADSEAILELSRRKSTILAADFLTDKSPLGPTVVQALGEMEGELAVMTAANLLLNNGSDGKGIIIGSITGIPPSEVIILGSDTAAVSAARTALAFGTTVKIFDVNYSRLQRLQQGMPHRLFTSIIHPQALHKALKSADALILTRALHSRDRYVIPHDYMHLLKKGAVVVDLDTVCGGRSELSRPTQPDSPVYSEDGLIFHCLPDITTLAAHTATILLSDTVSQLLSALGDGGGVKDAIRFDPSVQSSVAMYGGIITSKYLASQVGGEFFDIRLLII
ncbi:MAG: hypothetical protein II951_00430 [Bacteroidales bacterium]|nr:hypothetical protein [Bacteroidales bacterium]